MYHYENLYEIMMYFTVELSCIIVKGYIIICIIMCFWIEMVAMIIILHVVHISHLISCIIIPRGSELCSQLGVKFPNNTYMY